MEHLGLAERGSGTRSYRHGTNVRRTDRGPAEIALTRRLREALPMWQWNGFWRDRRVLVTGCTGLVGAWTVRALLRRGAHVVGLVRDQVAGSELVRRKLIQRIDVVRGELENQPLLERMLAE